MRTHNEGSTVTVTFSAFDELGQSYVPQSVDYKVTDCNSERILVNWTSITPEEEMTAVIPGTANEMVEPSRKAEIKTMTVRANAGLANQHFDEYEYRIENLKFVGE